MKEPNLIVFDMDGVLIDVSRSYREATRWAARLFFRGTQGYAALPDPLFSLDDLAKLKQGGGLNNDWDLTARVIHLLFACVDVCRHPSNAVNALSHSERMGDYDVGRLACFLGFSPSPLTELLDRYGRHTDPFIAACYEGDVGTGNVIKQIFQEAYLGPALFSETYGLTPTFHRGEGLIHQETLLVDRAVLEILARDHVLAIATGRPKAEADYALDRFALRPLFRLLVTLEDCIREEERIWAARGERASCQKPDPFMLDRIPLLVGGSFRRCWYLGDMPDDMLAARTSRTGFLGIGVTYSSPRPQDLKMRLLQAGADSIIETPADLAGLVDRQPTAAAAGSMTSPLPTFSENRKDLPHRRPGTDIPTAMTAPPDAAVDRQRKQERPRIVNVRGTE